MVSDQEGARSLCDYGLVARGSIVFPCPRLFLQAQAVVPMMLRSNQLVERRETIAWKTFN